MEKKLRNVLNDIKIKKLSAEDISKIKGIDEILISEPNVLFQINDILEEAYIIEKKKLKDKESISNLTKEYHKEKDAFCTLINDIKEANEIKSLNFEVLTNFLDEEDSIDKIKKHPDWYKDENGYVAILSRIILENNYDDRVLDRSIDMEWQDISRGASNVFDKIKTSRDISIIYDSFDMDFNFRKSNILDYSYNGEDLIKDFEKGKLSLEEVLVVVGNNLINNPYNVNSTIELLSTTKGEEILNFIEKVGDKNQFYEFKNYFEYLSKDEQGDSLGTFLSTNLFLNLIKAEDMYYHDTHSSVFLKEEDVVDVSNLFKNATLINSNEFEKGTESFGYCIIDEEVKELCGAYYDRDKDVVKVLFEDFLNDSFIYTYEVNGDDFRRELNLLVNDEFNNDEIRNYVVNFSDSILNSFVNEEFIKDVEKEEKNDFSIE